MQALVRRLSGRPVVIGSIVVAVALAVFSEAADRGISAAQASRDDSAAVVPKGWAPGGSDDKPQTQYDADVADLGRGGCGENAALLFRIRGSGATYGGYPIKLPNGDRLGAWLIGAGRELVRRGWRVRGLQAIYEAPRIPSDANVANPFKWKSFRDAATKAARGIRKALIAAHERCPSRSVLIAGHSLGNIALRSVLARLPDGVRKKIVRVDLFSDPAADAATDRSLRHPADLDGRLTNSGIDTAAARLAWKAGSFVFAGSTVSNLAKFRQKAYPIPGRVFQYCVPYDVVCDVNPVNLAKAIADPDGMGRIHVSYQFAPVGILAARSLKNYTRDTGGQSVRLLTVRCPVSVGVSGLQFPRWGARAHAKVPASMASRLSVYVGGFQRVVAPRGRRCRAAEGANGNSVLKVGGLGQGDDPHVESWKYPTCVGCIFDAVCLYFPRQAATLNQGMACHTSPPGCVGTKIIRLSPRLVRVSGCLTLVRLIFFDVRKPLAAGVSCLDSAAICAAVLADWRTNRR